VVVVTFIFQAFASPWDDPTIRFLELQSRFAPAPIVRGGTLRDPLTWAYRLEGFALPDDADTIVHRDYAPEIERALGARTVPWRAIPQARVSVGDWTPEYESGDEEPGDGTLRAGADLRLYPSIFELAAAPWLGVDGGGGATTARVRLPEAWAGIHTRAWTLGFGVRERWLGPARHGSLLLSTNATPAPLASGSWEGSPARSLGRFKVELGAGWLDRPRSDVERPGWLLADLRWLPIPEIELGLSRASIFGGVGRPPPDLGQLLVPTEPHVADDPDRTVPDQDELASIDLRCTLPIAHWRGAAPRPHAIGRVDYVEAYWEYGGEDLIARRVLGIPAPALAGVANLFGGEIASGPLTLTVETSRVLDDTFRWYTGHRVYHDGFTQDERSMGMARGDAIATWAAVAFFPVRWGAELSVEQVRAVAVAESSERGVAALATDEVRRRLGVSAWTRAKGRGWWRARAVLERGTGVDFVPGQDAWAWYVAVGR
jgi:hypothetical protein